MRINPASAGVFCVNITKFKHNSIVSFDNPYLLLYNISVILKENISWRWCTLKKLTKDFIEAIDGIAYIVRPLIMGNEKHNNNIFKRFQEFGIDVYSVVSSEFDGYSKWNSETNKPEIYLDESVNDIDRQRFTLAHELGHIIIDFKWDPVNKEPMKYKNGQVLSINFRDKDKIEDTEDVTERIANEFAAAFLMPEDTVKEQIKDYSDDFEKVDAVVNFFRVSERASTNRLKVLGLING